MLQALSIRDFIIVDKLDLEFDDGFTTLTGETGAGKSILIDALSLALGARNDGGVARAGCDKADISVTFSISENVPAKNWLSENEIDVDDALMLRRVIYADGRSRGFINGASVTVSQMKELGECLVDIYSQNAHHSLLKSTTQRQILDDFAKTTELASQVAQQYKAWHTLHTQRLALEKNAAAYADELAELRDKTRELQQLNFSPEDWQEIQQEHHRLANGASLLSGLEACIALLDDNDVNVGNMLAQVQLKLVTLTEFDVQLKEAADGVDSALIQLEEASRALNRYLQKAELDPARLAEVDNRIQSVHNVSRKYRSKPEELSELLLSCQARMAE